MFNIRRICHSKPIALAFVLIAAVFSATNAPAQPLEQLTIALARNTISPAEEIFTIAVPKHLGYFQAENLNISIIKTNGSMAALQAVASGNADIGYASSTTIAAAIEQGMPLVAFAGITVKWPYHIAVPEGSPIQTIAQLRGKRIGVISLASASYADLKANLRLAGLTEDDVTIIPVGAGIQAAMALRNRQVDAIDTYSDAFIQMRQNGIALTLLPRPEAMEQLFSVTMVTRASALQQHPDKLTRFARAAYQGIIYTQLYPDSALAWGFKEFPELAGSDDPAGQDALNTKETMLTALGDSIPADHSDPHTWGQWLNIGPERWQALLDFAYETGQTQTHMNATQVWNGSLMDNIYNFDSSLIQERNP